MEPQTLHPKSSVGNAALTSAPPRESLSRVAGPLQPQYFKAVLEPRPPVPHTFQTWRPPQLLPTLPARRRETHTHTHTRALMHTLSLSLFLSLSPLPPRCLLHVACFGILICPAGRLLRPRLLCAGVELEEGVLWECGARALLLPLPLPPHCWRRTCWRGKASSPQRDSYLPDLSAAPLPFTPLQPFCS